MPQALGRTSLRQDSATSLKAALGEAKTSDRTTVIKVDVDFEKRVPSYESWWDVPVAEVSEVDTVQQAYEEYENAKQKERYFL